MTETVTSAAYDVGGVLLERPFKVRRLGHVGYNCVRMDECVRFYTQLVGLRISDTLDLSGRAERPEDIAGFGDPRGYFLRYGGDHHSFVLFNKRVREKIDKQRRFAPGVTVNQISWQVGSLEEVVRGYEWLEAGGHQIQRTGRDMPGSNWHTYFYDPDGHTNELFYGMEQIGWDGRSKPAPMHERGFRTAPALPQISENDEVEQAATRGIDLASGSAIRDGVATYEVEGILLPRPFKVTKIGPVGLFVKDVDAATDFYRRTMGFELTEEATWEGFRCMFLRANTEHHSVALYPVALRSHLGLPEDETTFGIGMQVGSYRQLRAARAFFAERGAPIVSLPSELYPGIDYAFHVLDPDGHRLQFSFAMEQIGWDGTPRPPELRRRVDPEAWPEAIDASADAYRGEIMLGPLG
jgi:catechol 2,3-dioxygenase-like lactoylglutathione lyase family enzyme